MSPSGITYFEGECKYYYSMTYNNVGVGLTWKTISSFIPSVFPVKGRVIKVRLEVSAL